ncbi:MAG TPA: hypothetical protein PLI09_12080 [Candidatus Hydrogenedentes bacterium]|nr:hypothetical protein [Candidatus Hydrogenedentota bacterium]
MGQDVVEQVCPNCRRLLHIPAQYTGTHGKCNHCGKGFDVPKDASSGLSQKGCKICGSQEKLSSCMFCGDLFCDKHGDRITYYEYGDTAHNSYHTEIEKRGPINRDLFSCIECLEWEREKEKRFSRR